MKKIKSTLCFFAFLMSAILLMGCSAFDPPTDDTIPPSNDVVRYTVTEEEWNSWTTFPNYTIEEYTDSYRVVNKYTECAIEFDNGTIVIIDGDKGYSLKEKDDGYVIYKSMSMEYSQNGLLSGGYVYDEFVYNEAICAYELDLMDEMGAKWEVKFENGVPVSIIYTELTVVEDVEKTNVMTKLYTNVGTTVINVPEYVVEEDLNIRSTVTEEEWNIGVNAGNLAGYFFTVTDTDEFKFNMCSFKYAGNAIELDGKIIVFEGDKKYMLEEVNGTWYATEWNEYDICATLIPAGLKFNDFEYSKSRNLYLPKEDTDSGIYHSLGFEDGKLSFIYAEKSLNFEDPGYLENILFLFDVREIGTATIDVHEYVIVE